MGAPIKQARNKHHTPDASSRIGSAARGLQIGRNIDAVDAQSFSLTHSRRDVHLLCGPRTTVSFVVIGHVGRKTHFAHPRHLRPLSPTLSVMNLSPVLCSRCRHLLLLRHNDFSRSWLRRSRSKGCLGICFGWSLRSVLMVFLFRSKSLSAFKCVTFTFVHRNMVKIRSCRRFVHCPSISFSVCLVQHYEISGRCRSHNCTDVPEPTAVSISMSSSPSYMFLLLLSAFVCPDYFLTDRFCCCPFLRFAVFSPGNAVQSTLSMSLSPSLSQCPALKCIVIAHLTLSAARRRASSIVAPRCVRSRSSGSNGGLYCE